MPDRNAQSGADAQPRPAVDLDAMRRHHHSDGREGDREGARCFRDGLPWPCDTMRLLTEVEWLRASPNYATYACQACGRRDGLDAVLPSTVWERIANGQTLLCLWCMDARAKAAGVELTSVSLHFIGLALCGTSQSQADQEHISRLAADLEQCRQQLAAVTEEKEKWVEHGARQQRELSSEVLRLQAQLAAAQEVDGSIRLFLRQCLFAGPGGLPILRTKAEALLNRLDAAQQEPATTWSESQVRWNGGAKSEAEFQEMMACAACAQPMERHGPFQRCPIGDTTYTRKQEPATSAEGTDA